jgi:condensin complex subunit 3
MVASQDEDEKTALEFVVGQLLAIAQDRDFSDEVGRRELLTFLRSFLINTDASEDQIMTACRCLRKMSNDEVDFLRYFPSAWDFGLFDQSYLTSL